MQELTATLRADSTGRNRRDSVRVAMLTERLQLGPEGRGQRGTRALRGLWVLRHEPHGPLQVSRFDRIWGKQMVPRL